MKKLLLVLITSIALMSCGRTHKAIRLPNGAIVKAQNTTDIDYGVGARVCVRKTIYSGWEICTDGEMKDTTIAISYKRDGIDRVSVITHKVGTVSGYL